MPLPITPLRCSRETALSFPKSAQAEHLTHPKSLRTPSRVPTQPVRGDFGCGCGGRAMRFVILAVANAGAA